MTFEIGDKVVMGDMEGSADCFDGEAIFRGISYTDKDCYVLERLDRVTGSGENGWWLYPIHDISALEKVEDKSKWWGLSAIPKVKQTGQELLKAIIKKEEERIALEHFENLLRSQMIHYAFNGFPTPDGIEIQYISRAPTMRLKSNRIESDLNKNND